VSPDSKSGRENNFRQLETEDINKTSLLVVKTTTIVITLSRKNYIVLKLIALAELKFSKNNLDTFSFSNIEIFFSRCVI